VKVTTALRRIDYSAGLVLAVILLSACGGSRIPSAQSGFPEPMTVHASLFVPGQGSSGLQIKTTVPASAVFQETVTSDQEVFTPHRHGYGLAFLQSQTYPVVTFDKGLT
jgi:hypothetical protein